MHHSTPAPTLSSPQQEDEIPADFHLALASNETCILPSGEGTEWGYRGSADGRFGALLTASIQGVCVTLDSPGGSTSSTPRGPTCTGGGHGEAPPSVGGALQAHQRMSSLSGRQSASIIHQLPNALSGTATATPLARRIANRALHKAGDSAPISLPSISSLTGGAKLRDLGPYVSGFQSGGRGTGGALQPSDSIPAPPSPSSGLCTSPKPCDGSGVQARRATTMDLPNSPGQCDDASYTSVSASVIASNAKLASPGSSAISAPWDGSDPAPARGGLSSPTFNTGSIATGTGSTPPRNMSGRERFTRWQSIPARVEHRAVVEDPSADGQQLHQPHMLPHPPSHPPPAFPPPRRSGQGTYEASAAMMPTSRPHYPPSNLQPQQWAANEQRRRISEIAMRPQPPVADLMPLPRLRTAATAAAAAAAEASSRAVEGSVAALQREPSPLPEAPAGRSNLAAEAVAAAAADAQELFPSRPEPLRVLSGPPSPGESSGNSPTRAKAPAAFPGDREMPPTASPGACEVSGVPKAPWQQQKQQQEQSAWEGGSAAASCDGQDSGVAPRDQQAASPLPEEPMALSPVRPLSPVCMDTEVAQAGAEAQAGVEETKAKEGLAAQAQPDGEDLFLPVVKSSPVKIHTVASPTAAAPAADAFVQAPAGAQGAPDPACTFTPRAVPQQGLVHFSPAAPAHMLRAAISWGVTDYKVVRKLYAGYASSVYKATCLYSGVDVVLKAYNLAGLSTFLRNQVLRELDIHSRLRHPGVVHLMAAFREGDLLVLVQEYVRGGSLDRVRRKLGGRMTEFQAMHLVLLPLLGVMNYLHQRGIVHRDIKPENLLFTETWQLKVCDYGVSISLREERAVTRTGSREYMAPEVNVCPLKRGPEDNKDNETLAYTSAVDVWSLGALLYELLVGFTPFPGGPPPRKDGTRGSAGAALAYPGGVSHGARAFVRSCLELDPADRPTVQQLLQHPWILEALEHDASSIPEAGP